MINIACIDKFETLKADDIHIQEELEAIIKEHITQRYNDHMHKKQLAKIKHAKKKFSIALKFINAILNNLDRTPISNFLEFQNIDRLDLIKDEHKKVLDSMAPELFKFFSKTAYYQKTVGILLNVLRSICKELGYTLSSKRWTKRYGSRTKTHYLYSIIV